MVFLKEQAEQFIGQRVLEAKGAAKNIPYRILVEQELREIKTFGKEIFFCFQGFVLRVHLMLFGKYIFNEEINRELTLGVAFEDGEINFYASDCRVIQEPLSDVYDWTTDVLHPSFDAAKAQQNITRKPDQLICDALLDQTILAGVGNGIKNEVLFRAQIHPESVVGEIPDLQLKSLIRVCVTLSIEYLEWIREGTVPRPWQVYRQKECPRDRVPLRKARLGRPARSCYFCEVCQYLYLPDAL